LPEFELAQQHESKGSDKSTQHNYHQIHGEVIQMARGNVLEMGIGSFSTNQYVSGVAPGGKLKLFLLAKNYHRHLVGLVY
jgi:hypothetical protein